MYFEVRVEVLVFQSKTNSVGVSNLLCLNSPRVLGLFSKNRVEGRLSSWSQKSPTKPFSFTSEKPRSQSWWLWVVLGKTKRKQQDQDQRQKMNCSALGASHTYGRSPNQGFASRVLPLLLKLDQVQLFCCRNSPRKRALLCLHHLFKVTYLLRKNI